MRLPPGLSIRKVACPSQVRVPLAMTGSLSTEAGAESFPAGRGGALPRRNVRPLGEAPGVAPRLVAPALGAVVLASGLAGFDGLASLVLLSAIVASSVRLILEVGEAAEGRGDRWLVATSVLGLVCLVAAGTAHAPLLVLGLFA